MDVWYVCMYGWVLYIWMVSSGFEHFEPGKRSARLYIWMYACMHEVYFYLIDSSPLQAVVYMDVWRCVLIESIKSKLRVIESNLSPRAMYASCMDVWTYGRMDRGY